MACLLFSPKVRVNKSNVVFSTTVLKYYNFSGVYIKEMENSDTASICAVSKNVFLNLGRWNRFLEVLGMSFSRMQYSYMRVRLHIRRRFRKRDFLLTNGIFYAVSLEE